MICSGPSLSSVLPPRRHRLSSRSIRPLALPTDFSADAPLEVKLDVKHLDVGQFMRAADKPPLAGGPSEPQASRGGSTDHPRVTITMEAFDLELKRAALPAQSAQDDHARGSIDLGKARLRLTYAAGVARAELDFASAHGHARTRRLDARGPVVSPAEAPAPVVAKLPLTGKVAARDLDVASTAQLNPRLESMAEKVTADARLAATFGDPQVIGDVRWKNGKVVAIAPARGHAAPGSAGPEAGALGAGAGAARPPSQR